MNVPAILLDNITCVRQAVALLEQIGDDAYAERHPKFFNASVGGHIRHNLDHYLNFFSGLPQGRIDYETRARDPRSEVEIRYALAQMADIISGLDALGESDLDVPCTVRVNADSDDQDDPAHWSGSTVRRELQFLLGHAIHHHAQIAAMCRDTGVEPSQDFGMAPSTVRYKARQATAAETTVECAQ